MAEENKKDEVELVPGQRAVKKPAVKKEEAPKKAAAKPAAKKEAPKTEAPKKAAATQEVKADKKPAPKGDSRPGSKPGERRAGGKPGDKKRFNNKKGGRRPQRRDDGYEEKVIDIARVTKVVKGGRRFSFSAFVVVGDKKGKIGYGHGKANEVPDAIKKAIKDAKRNIVSVPIIEKRTVPHELQAKYLASSILIKPAPKGKGIIASGSIRSVVELAGYKDIYTKSLGRSRSKMNSVKATVKALSGLRTAKQIADLRDIDMKEILK